MITTRRLFLYFTVGYTKSGLSSNLTRSAALKKTARPTRTGVSLPSLHHCRIVRDERRKIAQTSPVDSSSGNDWWAAWARAMFNTLELPA